jgi:hypothetical protein
MNISEFLQNNRTLLLILLLVLVVLSVTGVLGQGGLGSLLGGLGSGSGTTTPACPYTNCGTPVCG